MLKNTNEFVASDADIHLGSSNFLPINSSILYDGYVLGNVRLSCLLLIVSFAMVLDNPDSSYVSGGFYSNWFDGTIKLSNETWHIEPSRKYGAHLANFGPSIIYNALDVDMTQYERNNPFRSKRFVMNDDDEHGSSFCGLDKGDRRETMRKETERLKKDDYEEMDFKSRYTRSKRQTPNSNDRERTCCYIYIRVDPTLWDVVYKNEGLNVRLVRLSMFIFIDFVCCIGKRTDNSCDCDIPLSDSDCS